MADTELLIDLNTASEMDRAGKDGIGYLADIYTVDELRSVKPHVLQGTWEFVKRAIKRAEAN